MLRARHIRTFAVILALAICGPWYCKAQGVALVFNQTSLRCADVAARALLMSCDVENREDALARIVARNYTACVESNGTQLSMQLPVAQIMIPTHLYAASQRLAARFTALRGKQVAVVPVDVDQLQQEALFEYANDLYSPHHAWILYLDSYFPLDRLSALTDVTNFTSSGDAAALWADLPPGFTRLSQSYYYSTPPLLPGAGGTGGVAPKTLSLPLDASTPLMYYLPDALAAHNLSVPRTWSEVLHVARVLNGSDFDGDLLPQNAVCFLPDPDCTYASALGMVMAPYLQYKGTNQGAFLRPDRVSEPLLSNPGAVAALEVFSGLMDLHRTLALQGQDCLKSATAREFVNGDCAMAFGWGELFKVAERTFRSNGSATAVKGKYAIAQLPGSEVVYDRDSLTLKDCTEELCPYGLDNRTEKIVHQQTDATAYVNRAPYLPYTGLVGVVSSGVPPEQQQVAFDFLVFMAESNKELALAPGSFVVPYRTSLLNSSDAALISEFAAAGFDPNATSAYMDSTTAALRHPNSVPGPIIPRVEALRVLLALAAANLSRGLADPQTVSKELQAGVVDQVLQYESGRSWMEQLTSAYWRFINYAPDVPRGSNNGGRNMDLPAVSLAVPVASALVVLVASTLYEFKKHRQHRSLFGKVVAPGPFEDTTLLVTDIQDSTALWEVLPSSVMDRAIKEHHTCLRKLLLKHSGYESATEGDSFLLAFHCPEDALLFAMEAQVALLECAWPVELLDCDVCRPQYVAHNDTDKRANLIADSADAASSLMALPRANSGLSNKSTSEDTSSPQASNLLSAPGSEVNTFITVCQASWKEATATTPNNVLIFRGLRVRMGLHTGIINEADVAYNKAAARMQYSGEILQYGKSVSDAAAGGMILLSEATYRRLPMERLWDKAMVMHVGEYKLKDDLPVLTLYQVTGRRLMGRLGYLSGMRFKEQLSKGVFAAPLGAVAMSYVGVVGASTLLAWDEAVTREALGQLHACVGELAAKWGGYLVEAGEAQAHCVFAGAAEALQWALALHQSAMELGWPEALLEHELTEELIVGDTVVFRGLRLRSGVDVGHAVGEVHALTGRICYRGKVVTRALRVMQTASSNQVLASGEAWAAAQAASAGLLQLRGIMGDRLGPFKLRGVADRVEMVQVRLKRHDVAGADAWAQDLQQAGGTGDAAAEAAEAGGSGAGAAADAAAAAATSRPSTASNLQALSGGGETLERPPLAVRSFGFLSRSSRSGQLQRLGASRSTRGAITSGPPAAAAGEGGGAPPQPSGSPRLFGSLRLFSSNRTPSFTPGLLHRMAPNRSRNGGGRLSIVRASAASGSAAAAAAATVAATASTATASATPSGSLARRSGANTAGSTTTGGGGGANGAITPISIMNPTAIPHIAVPTGAGSPPTGAAPLASDLPSTATPSSILTASLNVFCGFRGGGGGGTNANTRAASSLATSQPFLFPSAPRLLPSSWNLGGGGSGGGGLLAADGSPAVGGDGIHGLPSSTLRNSAEWSGQAATVGPSLPASCTHGHLGGEPAPTSADQQDVCITMATSRGAADAGGGAATAGGPAAAAAGGSGDAGSARLPSGSGPGWVPGEMLADVLQGVQEEDERASGRGSVVASRSNAVS